MCTCAVFLGMAYKQGASLPSMGTSWPCLHSKYRITWTTCLWGIMASGEFACTLLIDVTLFLLLKIFSQRENPQNTFIGFSYFKCYVISSEKFKHNRNYYHEWSKSPEMLTHLWRYALLTFRVCVEHGLLYSSLESQQDQDSAFL